MLCLRLFISTGRVFNYYYKGGLLYQEKKHGSRREYILFSADQKIENIKMEDSALDQNFPSTENIKLEPEIFLTEQEPMSAMSILQKMSMFQPAGIPSKQSCPQCDYVGSTASLKYHIDSVHLGIRYPCQQCDYMFKKKDDLKRHVQTIHEGIRYPCDKCDFIATQRGHLYKHIRAKHEGRCIYYSLTPSPWAGNMCERSSILK